MGSGSARGWSHIGVLRALHERGIEPSIVTGSSSGSLVAASYASNQLDALETWVRSLTKMDVWRLLDASFSGGGMMRGNRLMRAVGEQLEDSAIET
ncbi:MAG: patatin-like phospholipase family protein, partial [Woeseiaceae bacterium]